MNRVSSPLTSGTNYPGAAAALIPSRRAKAAYPKRLLADQGGAESLSLHERLTKADCESKRILRTLFWFGLLFILSLVALSYCAVLLPEPFPYRLNFGIKSVIFLGLVSVVCEVELLGELLWQRIVMNRLHQECRGFLLSLVASSMKASQRNPSKQTPVGNLLLSRPSVQKTS